MKKKLLLAGVLPALLPLTPLAQGQNKIANVNQPIESPTFINIYWDSAWDADDPAMKMGTVEAVTQAVIQSPYFTGLAEYGVKSASIAPGILPAPNCATKAPNRVGFYDPTPVSIAGFIQCEYDNGPPLLRQNNVIYNIILPPTSMESDYFTQNTCAGPGSLLAWHYHGLLRNLWGGPPIFTIVQTNEQCGGNAALFESLFHEMVEATTDPYPFDISIIPPHIDIAGENEIGDFCIGNDFAILLNGLPFNIASYWSNSQQKCLAPLTPATLWESFFSDANGYNVPQYGTTMMFADINGDGKADVCGRGWQGIWCELSTGAGFAGPFLAQTDFSDGNGWNQLVYYGSLRLADVDGDGRPDICGRGIAGVYCALNKGNGTFAPVKLWESFFGDATGWNLPEYGTTMMLADINGDGKADVCGRGWQGIWCELSTGAGFGAPFLAQTDFSDGNGWNQLVYYGSLRLADVDGDGRPDICGRGIAGVYCALNKGNGTFGFASPWDGFFSDATGWNLPEYGTTMMLADIDGDGKADVCGRGWQGIWCEWSIGFDTGFGPAFLVQSGFSDDNSWNLSVAYYGSIRFADVNGDGKPDICGRGAAGVYCVVTK
jgi:hypothetical protein